MNLTKDVEGRLRHTLELEPRTGLDLYWRAFLACFRSYRIMRKAGHRRRDALSIAVGSMKLVIDAAKVLSLLEDVPDA